MSRVFVCLVAVLLIPFVASARQIQGGMIGGVVLGPPTSQAPARDIAPAQTGASTISGHVVDGEMGVPLRKAQVRITALGRMPGVNENRLAVTDEQGRYEFKELAAGRYNLNASKGSYVTLSYGQTGSFDPGKPIEIKDGQTLEQVDFALPRGAVITGRVFDEFGDPVPDVQVAVLRSMYIQGRRRLMNVGRMGTTNDIGEFRVFALPPGQYYVSATLRSLNFQGAGQSDDRSGYAPTYYPGTSNEAEAQRVTITVGRTQDGIDFRLIPTRIARVTGIALDANGTPFSNAMIMVTQSQGFGFATGGNQTKPDGSFSISGLPPGAYTLRVMTPGPAQNRDPAVANITVAGEDINGVQLVVLKPQTITGRLIVDPAVRVPLSASKMSVGVSAANPDDAFIGVGMPPTVVHDDLTFEIKVRPGTWRLNAIAQAVYVPGSSTAPSGFGTRAVRYNSLDVTDDGVTVKAGEDVNGVEIELTNRITTLSGVVSTVRGDVAKDYSLLIFSRDSTKWAAPGYLRTVRSNQDGGFKTTGMRAGNFYAVALDYIDPAEAGDPEFLDRVRSKATPFSLIEGETKSLDLRLTNDLN